MRRLEYFLLYLRKYIFSIKIIFNGKEYFSICNVEITFDPETKILEIKVDAIPSFGCNCDEYFQNIKNIAEINSKPYNEDGYEADIITASIKFRFDGDELVKR